MLAFDLFPLEAIDLVPGNWSQLWRLNVSPKVKLFLWPVYRNCLPNRSCFHETGIAIPSLCVSCNNGIENNWHIFVACPFFALSCWRAAGLSSLIDCSESVDCFSNWLFFMLRKTTDSNWDRFAMVL